MSEDESSDSSEKTVIDGKPGNSNMKNKHINEQMFTVNLQLSQFNQQSPDLWFSIAEADFNANRITSDAQKYVQLLKALPFHVVEQLQDIVTNPPEKDKYKTLKEAILNRFSISRKKQLQQLLNERMVGNKRPSQMLREMRTLAKDSVNDEVLHQLWIERLPSKIRPLLIISENLSLDSLAEMADRFVDSLDIIPVMAIHNSDNFDQTKSSPTNNMMLQLERQMADLHIIIKEINQKLLDITLQQQQQQSSFNILQQQIINEVHHNQTRRARSRQRSQTPARNDICYYHSKWGKDARHCTAPCKFSNKNQEN